MMITRAEILAEFAANRKECTRVIERYKTLEVFLRKKKDTENIELLEEVMKAAKRYVKKVIRHIHKQQQFQRSAGSMRGEGVVLEEYDRARRIAHDALIACISAFNRNAAKRYGWQSEKKKIQVKGDAAKEQQGKQSEKGEIPVGGVFSLDPRYIIDPETYRGELTAWAFYLAIGDGYI